MTEQRDPYLIQVVAFANGSHCPIAGQFVETFDHEAHNGLGDGTFTLDPQQALAFDSFPEAWEFWRRQTIVNPIRGDGKPNRPLTCSCVEIAKRSTFAKGSMHELLKPVLDRPRYPQDNN